MARQPQAIPPVPEGTHRLAQAAFPRGHVAMCRREALESLDEDHSCAQRFPARGPPAEAPRRPALTTVLPLAEGLSDRQAADAVRGRLDWTDALGRELPDPGVDPTVLSAFRTR
jgi:transposase